MKKRPEAGIARRCTRVVNGERCEATMTRAQALKTLDEFGEAICVAHEQAKHAAEVDPVAQAYRDRVAARKGMRVVNNRLDAE